MGLELHNRKTSLSMDQPPIEEAIEKHVIIPWPIQSPPTIISGLLVATNKTQLRLCMNPSYLNLFLHYNPVSYENLTDLKNLELPGDWGSTMDDKSGYWRLPMHPSTWPYLAFQFDNKLYCFTHLPFGISSACFIYTTLKQTIIQPPREWGTRCIKMIYDTASLQTSQPRAQAQAFALALLYAAIGFTLNKKSLLKASQHFKFLGLLVDLQKRMFQVPEDKNSDLTAQINQLLAETHISNRTLAQVAGKLSSMSLALDLAPLLSNAIIHCKQGLTDWDTLYPSSEALKEDLTLSHTILTTINGKHWDARDNVIQVVGDASESAIAAFTPNNELPHPIVIPFTQPQALAAHQHTWASTAREVLAQFHVLRTFQSVRPGFLF
jgi:hypothetical protein